MGNLVTKEVNFNGASLMAVQTEDRKIHVGVKWICQGMGLSDGQYQNQTRKINDDIVLSKGIAKMHLLTKGGKQEVLCIELHFLPLWLAKINANIIDDPAVQDKLIEYQLHAADVLAKAFIEGRTIPKEKPNNIKEQEVEARLRNARVRESNQYLKIAAQIGIPEYKYILQSKAAETLAGTPILPMQEAERKTYSATEIGEKFGVTKNMIGKVANANGLKTKEFGKLFYSKSEFSVKEVETWRYYDNVIPVFAKLFGKEVA